MRCQNLSTRESCTFNMNTYSVTYKDIFIGNLMRLYVAKELLNTIQFYSTKFKSPLSVLLKNRLNQYPMKVVLKNRQVKTIRNFGELLGILYGFEYDPVKDLSHLDRLGYPVKLSSAISNGEIIGIFYFKDYQFLECAGKDVVDIGANIADSSIYFAMEGANSVIAMEPFVKNYEIAKNNVQMNNLASKIVLLHAACSSKEQDILVDSEREGVFNTVNDSSLGVKINCITLQNILDRYKLKSPILKMDCEGCEYDIILNSHPDTIKQFSVIQIEYHYGYYELKQQLHKLGFAVNTTKPRLRINKFAKNHNMYVGWLYAQRT
jgi:FkbM family methyltransferase